MSTYTFIMEFRGSTYISQVKAANLSKARVLWVKSLTVTEIAFLGEKGRLKLLKELKEDDPVPILRTVNVWCFDARVSTGFIMVNVVKTDVT